MDKKLALEKEKQLGISTVQIVREEYEMFILNKIFQSSMGKKLIFRGGTALRLAYNSPRFSDDLDFTQIEKISVSYFKQWCGKVAEENPNLELSEAIKKRYTLFALFKIKDPTLKANISIKVEISTRKETLKKESDYQLMSLTSDVTPLSVLAQVATLEKLKKEKISIANKRTRDIFDLWFIGQKLGKPYEMDFKGLKPKRVKGELNRLLTRDARRLLEPWLPQE